ncbi:TnsA endonuclease N-terminal domain-containing protein [Marivirga atlantica]|uniref:TnsA endonuclease N-terminal domain-containing protein n=1 Tax=Marivirga atlantica TaxID=1548457 RepID=A0A937AC40_9BACT|nr:TnsA endonuclease N-terminal domain-containing protein [Marivirga atlantica]MBL0763906.1 TnsA endonuclease N-terminal domain-containing protein [Marivirga atlantica]
MKGPSYKSKIKQKRGYGQGVEYIPWIKVGEFSGRGNSVRSLGLKHKREHHFHSNKEAEIFYIFDLSPEVEEIREQFPLLDYELARNIAEEMGISYPSTKNSDPHILTTDFFVIYKSGTQIAYTFKYLKELSDKPRKLELFELERRYWKRKGIEFKIITDKNLPSRKERLAYKDLHASCQNNNYELTYFQNVYAFLNQKAEHQNMECLNYLLRESDKFFAYSPGTSLRLIKILIARRLITTDLNILITDENKLLTNLKFNVDYATSISESDLAA